MINRLNLIILALSISACTSPPKNTDAGEDAPLLVNTTWRVKTTTDLTINFRFIPKNKNGQSYYIENNSPEGRYYMDGRGGCNGAEAGYLQNGWSLVSTGVGPSTVKSCSQTLHIEDARMARAFAKVRTFTITEKGNLVFLDEGKQALLNLNPVQ